MLIALADVEFRSGPASPLVKLCEAGAQYGWLELELPSNSNLLSPVSPRAKAGLTRDLRRRLERLTRPCLELERTSFDLAVNALGVQARQRDPRLTERAFLGDEPSNRLFLLFKRYPVLARLWGQLIAQWREHATEVLLRFTKDKTALARTFFGGQPVGMITDFRCSLSDPHHHGQTVMELHFGAGAVIYKPRSGDGEWEWGSLLDWINAQSFRPKLRAGRVLRRRGYCWMERIDAAPCKSRAAARRFYERMGGMMAAACLLKAVDCHRDNLIASGEDPVLVDADALWHVSPDTKAHTSLELFYRMGFFPNSNPSSLQSRSSVLSRSRMVQYSREVIDGFNRAWECILGTKDRRRSFAKRLRRIQSRERRWIYRATEKYASIKRASIQPAVLRSGVERQRLIARLCTSSAVPSNVIQAEIAALKDLDIPYFVRRGKERIDAATAESVADVREALRRVLT